MKIMHTSELPLEILLREFKVHLGQAELILQEIKRRGLEQSARAIIKDYYLLCEAINIRFCLVKNGEPLLHANGTLVGGRTREEAELLRKSSEFKGLEIKEVGEEKKVLEKEKEK